MRRAAILILVAACTGGAPPGGSAPLVDGDDDAGVCTDCGCLAVECDADAAPSCETCEPACRGDDECGPGMRCDGAGSCTGARCVCPDGEPPWEDDENDPCCRARDANGACCDSGVVDTATGLCVCDDPTMLDRGQGCMCPDGMEPDPDTGGCRCSTPGATIEPDTGTCECPDGTWERLDEYTGSSECVDDDAPPPECADENAAYDPLTGTCECKPGYVLRNVDDRVTPACAPPPDDDDDDADAGVPEPDAGPPPALPDAAPPPPFPDAGAPAFPDAGVPIRRDASVAFFE